MKFLDAIKRAIQIRRERSTSGENPVEITDSIEVEDRSRRSGIPGTGLNHGVNYQSHRWGK